MRGQDVAWLIVAFLLFVHLPVDSASGQDQGREGVVDAKTDPRFDKVQHKRWIDFYCREAASYNFYRGPGHTKKLQFHPSPVLLYTNPVGARGLTHGAVFVWTWEGRSEVVGAIWSHANTPRPNQRAVAHEFHSLSENVLTAERNEEVVWSTTQAGIRWVAIPDGRPPSPSKPVRLIEMRTLAKELTAVEYGMNDGSKNTLRLLPQPLYRYRQPALVDGALFAYCLIWDPEVIVVIESRKTERGQQWRYAPVRFSHLTLALRQNQKEVWRDMRDGPGHRDPAMGYKLMYKTSVENETIEQDSQLPR